MTGRIDGADMPKGRPLMSAFVAAMSVVDPKQKSEGTPFGTWDGDGYSC